MIPLPRVLALSLAATLGLAACAPHDETAAPTPISAPPPVPAPVVADVPKNESAVVSFEGFGPAKFGADEEAVRQSWGRPVVTGAPAAGSTCYQMAMKPPPEKGKGVSFLFEDGGFSRYDVDSTLLAAPGDFVVGAKAEDIKAKFGARVEEQPAKYVEGGKVLIVKPEGEGDTRLMFDVDATGIVTAWRIGRPPQIYYVEGCG